MEIRPTFPEHRLHDPKRQAELAVYRDLEASALPGVALYGPRPGPNGREMDFAVWLKGIARVVLEVKGGRYCVDAGEWFLEGPGGAMPKDNPLLQAWDNAMSLRNFLCERLSGRRGPFIIAAVVFADMEPDPGITALTAGAQAHVLWGAGDIAGRLAGIAAEVGVNFPPGPLEVQRETALLRQGLEEPEAACPSTVEGLGLDGRQVIIQHVEHLHIYTQLPASPEEMAP